jgi:CRP-like cAMP-binding protein
MCNAQGRAVVLQKKTDDGEDIEVGQLGPSDYFGNFILSFN